MSIISTDQRNFFKKHGWVIISGAVSKTLCDKVFNESLNHATHLLQKPPTYFDVVLDAVDQGVKEPIPILRDVTRTFVQKLGPLHGYMLRGHGFAYLPSVIELKSSVSKCYAHMYKTNNFLFSLDNPAIGFPPEYSGLFSHKKADPFHLDDVMGVGTIQSWVAIRDVNDAADATLGVLDGSNVLFNEFQKHKQFFCGENHNKWAAGGHMLTKEDLNWYETRGAFPLYITCKKGDMVFWDSTTVHCGTRPRIKERTKPNIRGIVYTHAFTYDHLSYGRWKRYKKLIENGKGCNHICDAEIHRQRVYGNPAHVVVTPKAKTKEMADKSLEVYKKLKCGKFFGMEPMVFKELEQRFGKKSKTNVVPCSVSRVIASRNQHSFFKKPNLVNMDESPKKRMCK